MSHEQHKVPVRPAAWGEWRRAGADLGLELHLGLDRAMGRVPAQSLVIGLDLG